MKKLHLLQTMLLLVALLVGSTGSAWGQSDTYGSNITLPENGTYVYTCTVKIDGKTYSARRLGKSGNNGSTTITVPAGTKVLHLHAAAWKDEGGALSLSTEATGVTISPSSWTLTADSGISGSGSEFTINKDNASTTYYKSFTLTGVTSATAITLTTASKKRAVYWGVNAEVEPTSVTIKNGDAVASSLAMTVGDEDVTLSATVAPALASQTVTWYSDNTSVATVSSTGVVHAVAAGTANIKATSSLSSIYGTCAVTVSAATSPAATVSTSSLSFGDVEVGQSKEMQFTITPANLEGALSISCNNDKYTISPTSIAQDVTTAQTITVTAKPTAYNDDMSGAITISGGGLAANRTVELSATPYQEASVTLSATNGAIKEDDETKTSLTSRVGSSVTLTAVPNSGYLFDGWTATGATPATSESAETEFTFTSTTPTITANFIADPNIYVTINETDIQGSTNTKSGYGTVKVITKDGYTWSHNGYQTNTDYNMIQLRVRTHTNGVSWIKLPTFPGKIEKIDFVVTSASGAKRTSDKTATVLYFQTNDTKDASIIKSSNNDESNTKTIDLTTVATKYNTGYITAGGGIRVWEVTVTYRPATVTAAGWGTYVAPCNVEFEDGDAYVISAAGETTTLKSVTSVPVNTPVLLKGAGTKNISVTSSASAPASNLLKVSNGTITGDDAHIYVLSNKNNGVGFYLWDSTASAIPKGKVYLDTTGATSKVLDFFSLDDSKYDETVDDTDGISTMQNAQCIMLNETFNLAGQKVGAEYKGIVVVNGKKIVRK